jgi:hypothetical protein
VDALHIRLGIRFGIGDLLHNGKRQRMEVKSAHQSLGPLLDPQLDHLGPNRNADKGYIVLLGRFRGLLNSCNEFGLVAGHPERETHV